MKHLDFFMTLFTRVGGNTKLMSILLLTGLLSLTSCFTDDKDSLADCTGDELTVNVTMSVPTASTDGTQFRSRSVDPEIILTDLTVLAFDKVNKRFAYATYGTNITIQSSDNITKQAEVTSTLKLPIRDNEEFYFVLFGNMQAEIRGLLNDIESDNCSIEEVISRIKFNALEENNTRPLPMWGYTQDAYEVNSTSSSTVQKLITEKIFMLRSVAKIDFYYSPKAKGDKFPSGIESAKNYSQVFQLEGISVHHIPKQGLAGAYNGNYLYDDVEKKVIATRASVPTGVQIDHTLDYSLTSTEIANNVRSFIDKIYVTEQNNSTINEHNEKICVVIKGKYDETENGQFNGAPVYYRVDILDGEGNYMDILRNHRYIITLTAIDGKGAPDVATALEETAVNIKTEILKWEDVNMEEVWYDGYYWYYTSPRTSIQPYNESFDGFAASIRTNSKYTDIRVKYPEDEVTKLPIMVSWMKHSSPWEPKISNKTTIPSVDGKDETTADLLVSLDEYDAINTSSRSATLEVEFYDHLGNLRVVVPVVISQQSREIPNEIEHAFVIPVFNPTTTIPDSVYVLAKGVFTMAYFKTEITGSRFFDYTDRIYSGTIINGYNQYQEETGDTQYSDYSSVKSPNPELGAGGWAFHKPGTTAHGAGVVTSFYYSHYIRLNDTAAWPSSHFDRNQYRGFYMPFDTWPDNPSKSRNDEPTVPIDAENGTWKVTYKGFWEGKATLQVRDGLENSSRVLGAVDIYPPATATDEVTLFIPVADNNDGVDRKLHLWFSCTGREKDFMSCAAISEQYLHPVTWQIFSFKQSKK